MPVTPLPHSARQPPPPTCPRPKCLQRAALQPLSPRIEQSTGSWLPRFGLRSLLICVCVDAKYLKTPPSFLRNPTNFLQFPRLISSCPQPTFSKTRLISPYPHQLPPTHLFSPPHTPLISPTSPTPFLQGPSNWHQCTCFSCPFPAQLAACSFPFLCATHPSVCLAPVRHRAMQCKWQMLPAMVVAA